MIVKAMGTKGVGPTNKSIRANPAINNKEKDPNVERDKKTTKQKEPPPKGGGQATKPSRDQ